MSIFIEDYEEKDGVIFNKKGEQVTNGTFKAVRYRNIIGNLYTLNMVYVNFTIVFKNNRFNEEIQIPIIDIKNFKIDKYIPKKFIIYIGTKAFQKNFICNKILQDLKSITIEEIYALEPGHNLIEGKHLFCLGNCIINSDNGLNRKCVSLSDKILKSSMKNVSYIKWINIFCRLDKDTMPVLLLSVIVAITRPLLKEAGTDTLFVPYIYGETGKGKSTYAKLLTDIFENVPNNLTFSSDIMGIREMMAQTRDFVVLADDLNSTSSSRVKASKEAKVSEIIQQAANGDLIRYKGTESCFKGLLFVTAEYVLKNESTINRCILIHLLNEMDTEKVNLLKQGYGLYIRFLKDYIVYVYNDYENFVKYIKNLKEVISVKNTCNRDAYKGIIRLEQTEKTLMVILNILMDFFKNNLKLPDNEIPKYKNMFENSIRNCIDTTKGYIRNENKDIGTMYINEILNLIIYGQETYVYDDICEIDYKTYKRYKRNGQKSYYFIYDGYMCFTGDDITDYFKQLEGFEYSVSKKAISEQLVYHGLLKIKGGERSYPCNVCNNKTRYYHVDIRRLLDFTGEVDRFAIEGSWLKKYLR